MIQYDPHNWRDHFFDFKGSLLKEIIGRVAVTTIWAAGVVCFHFYVRRIGISLSVHTLVGVALGLLLVFRTNASYDRFWEGRKLWGAIVNDSRNLIRAAILYLKKDRDLLFELTRWTTLFPWATMSSLRGESSLGPVAAQLGEEAVIAQNAHHTPLYIALRMSHCLARASEKGLISDYIRVTLDQDVHSLVDNLGACERIRKTPLPFAYVVHLRRALVIYCMTLPFALVDAFGWLAVLAVFLVAYTFYGIEEIGVEIEGPFGYDENDLPLEQICTTIQRDLFALTGIDVQPKEPMPGAL